MLPNTRGVLMLFSRCTDPAKEDDFNRWYDTVHIPNIYATKTKGFLQVKRYKLHPVSPNPGRATYLAVYEMSSPRPDEVLARLRAAMDKRKERGLTYLHESLEKVNLSTWRRSATAHGKGATPPKDGPRGLFLTMVVPVDPKTAEQFHTWYERHHLKDVLKPGFFHTSTRFLDTAKPRNEATALTLIETDMPVEEAYRKQRPFVPGFYYPPNKERIFRPTMVACYERIL